MRRFLWITMIALAGLVTITSCDREKFDYGAGSGTGEEQLTGVVSFAALSLSVQIDDDILAVNKVTNRAVSTDNFIIRILSEAGTQVGEDYRYSSLNNGTIELPVGKYSVVALSHIQEKAAWETPFYLGKEEFTIIEDKTTTIETLICKLQNIMVTVEFDPTLKDLMEDDYEVLISGSAGGQLTYTKDNITSVAYYQAFDDEGNIFDKLYATFDGTVDGELISLYSEFTDVQAGDYRIIRYKLVESNSGTGDMDVTLNAECEQVNKDYEVDPGDSTDPGTDPGTDPQPSDGITITGVGFDIDEIQQAYIGMDVTLNIEVKNLISDVVIQIKSTDEEFSGIIEEFHLSNFSLVNSSEEINEALVGFGFPVKEDVYGKQEIEFEIAMMLIGMLCGYEGLHEFVINVTDQTGDTVAKTLKIKVEGLEL